MRVKYKAINLGGCFEHSCAPQTAYRQSGAGNGYEHAKTYGMRSLRRIVCSCTERTTNSNKTAIERVGYYCGLHNGKHNNKFLPGNVRLRRGRVSFITRISGKGILFNCWFVLVWCKDVTIFVPDG